MTLINECWESKFKEAESCGITTLCARSLLESALKQQFRKLVMGMYSYTYLKKPQHFSLQALFDSQGDYFDANDDYEIFKEKFSVGVVRKEWPIISIKTLNEVQIRIFNKSVYLFNSFDINEQLARLNSSYRVFVAAIEDLAMSKIEGIIGADSSRNVDGRFLYGQITNLSATYFGQLYDFVKEDAVSPYFDDNVPGFTIEGTTIIRQNILYKIKGVNGNNFEDIASTYLHTWTHEILHGVSYGFKLGLPFASLFWDIYLQRDIIRYFETPHTINEGKDAIMQALDNFLEAMGKIYSDNKIKMLIDEKFKNYDSVFSALLSESKLLKTSNGENAVYQSAFALEDKQCEVC
ncbi:MAG: hypothetical protein FWG90_02810 [Oscillospiraceae bacterium]|nr:hypothetical protein [Oscillospiraceae bacterium]